MLVKNQNTFKYRLFVLLLATNITSLAVAATKLTPTVTPYSTEIQQVTKVPKGEQMRSPASGILWFWITLETFVLVAILFPEIFNKDFFRNLGTLKLENLNNFFLDRSSSEKNELPKDSENTTYLMPSKTEVMKLGFFADGRPQPDTAKEAYSILKSRLPRTFVDQHTQILSLSLLRQGTFTTEEERLLFPEDVAAVFNQDINSVEESFYQLQDLNHGTCKVYKDRPAFRAN